MQPEVQDGSETAYCRPQWAAKAASKRAWKTFASPYHAVFTASVT